MKYITPLFFILTLFIGLFSCQNRYRDPQILATAENLIISNPDSAFILLEEINTPASLNKKLYATYLLLQAQAKDKTDRNLSEDTLLSISIDYFTKAKLHKQAAYAYFYQNRVYQSQNQTGLAIECCCSAKNYAEKTTDLDLLGLIYHDLGHLYKEQFNYEEAIDCYRKGLDCFQRSQNDNYSIYMYKRIGDIFLISNLNAAIDSALTNYHKALEYANEIKNQTEIYHTYQSIALSLYDANQFEKAKTYLKKAIEMTNDPHINFGNYTFLSGIYLNLNKTDSALIFLDKTFSTHVTLDSKDKYAQKKLLYRINFMKKDYLSAIYNIESCLIYKDSIYTNIMSQKILEIKKKYEKEKLQKERDELIIQRLYFFFICLLVLFSIPFIIIAFINKNKRHEAESLKKHQELLLLEEMLASKNNTENKLKGLLIEKLDITKKVTLMQSYTNVSDNEFVEQYHKIFGQNTSDTMEWDNLYPILDELYDNFTSKLKLTFPALTEKEFQHCCLIRAGFDSEEICLFLSYEYNTIRSSKLRLRKKMGFDTFEDFTEYLNNL